jgi:phospholipid/cholesterol/gamma-HCH transport system substrate-binding protein
VRERVRNVLVGVCTIGALAGGAGLLFFFGELEPFFARRWQLQVAFNDAGGLRKGSLVTLNGVPVGAIERVEIWTDSDRPVLITAAIDDGVRIPDPSVPSVQASLLGSGARLELTAALPMSVPARSYAIDRELVLRGTVVPLENRLVERVSKELKPLVENFKEIGALARNLNGLVKPMEPGAPEDPENVRTAIRRLTETLARADAALADAQGWLSDEQLRTDVRDAAHGASELMVNASRMAQRIEALADSLAQDATALRDGALPMLDRASVALDELRALLVAARTGDGTVGRMMKDPALYEGLADAAKRLDEALAKINLLIEKIRAEGLDVELFPK